MTERSRILVPMRHLTAAAAALTLIGALAAGCAADPAPAQTAVTEAAQPAPSTPPEAMPPQECIDYESQLSFTVDGAEQLAAAAATAQLPADVVLNPGVQTIPSTDEPGMLEAVAHVCSTPMAKTTLLEVANALAVAIKADPVSDQLAVLVVSSWAPDRDGVLQRGATVRTDYQLHTWTSEADASTMRWESMSPTAALPTTPDAEPQDVDRTLEVQRIAGDHVTRATETTPGHFVIYTDIVDPRGDDGSPEAQRALAICMAVQQQLGATHVRVQESDESTFAVIGGTFKVCTEV